AESRQDIADIATWNPTIAIADGAASAMRESAADMDRRVGVLRRVGAGGHRVGISGISVVFWSLLWFDFLLCLDTFPAPLLTGGDRRGPGFSFPSGSEARPRPNKNRP